MPRDYVRYRSRLKERARIAVDPRNKGCAGCGSQIALHFAHVRPTGLNGAGRGSMKRRQDVLRSPWNYRLLCRTCHRLFDKILAAGVPDPALEEPIPF